MTLPFKCMYADICFHDMKKGNPKAYIIFTIRTINEETMRKNKKAESDKCVGEREIINFEKDKNR